MFERHAIFLSISAPLLYPRGGLVPGPGQGRPSGVFQFQKSLVNLANLQSIVQIFDTSPQCIYYESFYQISNRHTVFVSILVHLGSFKGTSLQLCPGQILGSG